MRQETTKKNKKLVWLIAGLAALLVVVGVVLAIFLLPGQQGATDPTGPVGGRPALYWNIDRDKYLGDETSAGLSKREPAEDGLYHMTFAFEGEQVEYTIADKRLVNAIDNYDVVGLVFDDAGNVIDAVDPTDIATEVGNGFFVMRVSDNRLDTNSSILMNGMNMSIKLTELAKIYNVAPDAQMIGQIDTLETMDKLMIYANDKEEVTHIYITERQPAAEVYWRADRFYDSKAASTTRVPDENGVYTIPFAYKGQQVQLQCKDKDLVSKIDKSMIYNAPFGLLFDEEGYIVDTVDPAVALRGKLLGASYNITEINGNDITATYLLSGGQNGSIINFTIDENTEIYNCCIGGSPEFIGEATELQMMDRIVVYSDFDGKPLLIYVMYRMVDSPIYYNITRKYSGTTKETTRVPDASGYYVFEMTVQGKQITVKTKDKALASKVDSFAYKMLGLKLNGNIIEKVYTPYVVCGSDAMSPGTERFIVSQTGTIVSFASQGGDYAATTNRVTSADVEVYDVSGYPGTEMGEKTTLRNGDKVRLLQDIYGNLTHIYITERYTGYPVYYNLTRYYSAKTGTTRTPDADGYYVYDMVSKGKQVTVKTKNKELADYIDQQNPNIVALKVNSSGIVTDAGPAQSSVMYGRKVANNGLFSKIEDGVMSFTLASTGKTYTTNIADDHVAYNCGQVYDKFRGEKTKLIAGDQMVAIRDDSLGQVVEVYVTLRKVDCELYYNRKAMYNSVTKETTREPDAEGYYVFELAVNGELKEFKTKDKEVATYIDARGTTPFAMTVKGDLIKQAFPVTAKKGLKTFAVSNYDFMDAGNGKCVLTCNIPTNANYGKTLEAPLARNYKAYDVSSYAENFGEQVKLKVGDRVICYYNDAGEIEWFFIWYRNTREKGAWSTCSHCNERVYWMPYTATAYTEDAHVYLTHDRACPQVVVGEMNGDPETQPELILDLNGKTLSTSVAADRLFVVYGGLSIMDTAGGGKLEARNRTTTTSCGGIMVQQSGVFNLYSGTLTGSAADTKIANGGILFVGAGSTFNMYGGTVTGGKATNGGNVYVGQGTFNMEGGTIDGDVVIATTKANVTVGGKSVIGKGTATGLQLPSGMKLELDKVTGATKVAVDTTGVFTESVSNPSGYLTNFTPYDSDFPVFVDGDALACGRVAKCEDCGEEVYWSRFSTAACTGEAHLVLTGDVELTGSAVIKADDKVVVDLNGHTLSTKADRTFSVEVGELSIQDSKGGGKVVGRTNDSDKAAGTIMAYSGGTLNLYGGEICGSDAETNIGNGGVLFIGANSYFNMYGGTVTGTEAALGGAIYGGKGGVVTIHDGTVTGGKATNGGNIYSEGTVIIHDGSVAGGQAALGGNIYSKSAVRLNGGTVSGGHAANGGNIYMELGAVNLQGGTVENGVATPTVTYNDGTAAAVDGMGGNIYADFAVVKVGAEEGEVTAAVTGGKAYQGGNIYSAKLTGNDNKALTVNAKGVVSNGQALVADDGQGHTVTKNIGGNIYCENTMSVIGSVSGGKAADGGNIFTRNWTGIYGTVSGGEATRGGNVFATGTLEITGGTVKDGKADKGGNILTTANVTLDKNAEVSGGRATTSAGNIFMTSGGKTLTVKGKVLNGTSAAGGNISVVNNVTITVDGGEITGGSFKLGTAQSFTVSGAAKIDGLVLDSGEKLTLGELTEGASITVDASGVFTNVNEKAADYAGYFHYAHAPSDIGVHAVDNALVMGIRRYCSKCETEVMWEAFSAEACTGTAHLLLTGDATVGTQISLAEGTDVTVDLNGHTLTATGGRFVLLSGKMQIQDTSAAGDGVITSTTKSTRNGGTITLAATGELTLYSGTLTMEDTAQASTSGGVVSVGDGTFVMNGGMITGGKVGYDKEAGAECSGANVYVRGGTFTMNGGTIDGSTPNSDQITLLGGSVYGGVSNDGTKRSVITINGGQIINGTAAKGGNIYSVGTVFVNDGATVSGGKAELGGNLYGTYVIRVNGGTVSGGQATNGGNVYMAKTTYKQVGGTVTGGQAANGGNIYSAEGKVLIEGGIVENGVATPTVTYSEGNTTATEGKGGNIYADFSEVTVGLAEGDVIATVTGGKAYLGGNIYSARLTDNANKALTVNVNGVVSNGEALIADDGQGHTVAKNMGGNIYTQNTASYKGSITGGKATDGGNIYSNTWTGIYSTISGGEATSRGGNIFTVGTLELYSGAKVQGGKADKGGNILTTANVTVHANAEISGGDATTAGGNVFIAAGNKTLTVKGKILNGTSATGGNINVVNNTTITVDGGEITGGSFKLGTGKPFTVSGAAKIDSLVLPAGNKLTLGTLTEGASITLTATGVFTEANENAADYKKYFFPTEKITVLSDNTMSMS